MRLGRKRKGANNGNNIVIAADSGQHGQIGGFGLGDYYVENYNRKGKLGRKKVC